MQRVTGIGGIFFQAKDAPALRAWYKRHLGIDVQGWGGTTFAPQGETVWSISDAASPPGPGGSTPFTINYRVADLDRLMAVLREEGCEVIENPEPSEYGKFGWVIDPEGNKIELWQE